MAPTSTPRVGSSKITSFGFFASVPIFDIEGSLREAEYALDTLKADGIVLMTNIGDKLLGDPYYFPLFEELNRRKAVIYTHPFAPNCTANMMMPSINDSVIEFASDTSRAIGRILFSGAAQRFKDIKFIFSHAGGTMPFILERYTRHPLTDKAIAALVPKIGFPILPSANELEAWRRMPLPGWLEIYREAVKRDDEHDLSLSFSAGEEFKHYGDPLYTYVAAKRLNLV